MFYSYIIDENLIFRYCIVSSSISFWLPSAGIVYFYYEVRFFYFYYELRLFSISYYSRFTKKRNDLKYTTLGWEPVSIVHYTRPGSSIKRPTPNSLATQRHVNWPVVYPKSSYKIMDPVSAALPQNLRRIFIATLVTT